MGASVQITEYDFVPKGVEKGTKKGIIQTCILMNNQAKSLAPEKYGQLRNSIMYKVENETGGFNNGSGSEPAPDSHKLNVQQRKTKDRVVGYQGTNSDHWFPEFGTRYMPAQPFERPAKEIIVDGGRSKDVMVRYSKEQMLLEYLQREAKRISIG